MLPISLSLVQLAMPIAISVAAAIYLRGVTVPRMFVLLGTFAPRECTSADAARSAS